MFLRAQGGCCDCEILCDVPLSRDYTIGGLSSKGQRSGSTNRLTADQTSKDGFGSTIMRVSTTCLGYDLLV